MSTLPYLFPIKENGEFSVQEKALDSESAWPHLTEKLREDKVQLPLLFSIPEYQIEPAFYFAAKSIDSPAIIGTVYNLPYTRELIRILKPDAIVSTPKVIGVLLDDLKKHKIELNLKVIYLFSKLKTCRVVPIRETYVEQKFVVGQYPIL